MKPMVSRVVIFLSCLVSTIAAALVVPGCGVSSASPNTVQVWGRVTHNGYPLQKACSSSSSPQFNTTTTGALA